MKNQIIDADWTPSQRAAASYSRRVTVEAGGNQDGQGSAAVCRGCGAAGGGNDSGADYEVMEAYQ